MQGKECKSTTPIHRRHERERESQREKKKKKSRGRERGRFYFGLAFDEASVDLVKNLSIVARSRIEKIHGGITVQSRCDHEFIS